MLDPPKLATKTFRFATMKCRFDCDIITTENHCGNFYLDLEVLIAKVRGTSAPVVEEEDHSGHNHKRSLGHEHEHEQHLVEKV